MSPGAHTPLTRAHPDQSANLTDHTAGPDLAPAKACQPPLTRRHTKPLEQAGSRLGELMRLERIIEIEPGSAIAYSRLSLIYFVEYVNQWHGPWVDHLPRVLRLARRAVEMDENEPLAHDALSIGLLWLRYHDEAQRAAERMIELDPNFASGYMELGNVHHFKGEHESAVELYRRAHRLDPQFDLSLQFLGRALFVLGRFDEAEAAFKRRLALAPRSDMARFYLASLYGRTGRHDTAMKLWCELLEIKPDFSVEHFKRILPYRDPAAFDWFIDGLCQAGVAVTAPQRAAHLGNLR